MTSYTQRQGVRRPNQRSAGGGSRLGGGNVSRSNIRGVRNLGAASAACGGGG